MVTKPLIVIVGPTASGKTALAIKVAKKYDGEIICADSRTIYKGMDIGTAKPTEVEMSNIPHFGLDLVNPGEKFTVYDFKEYASAKIDDIRQRGKIPVLVGGSGLYIDAIIFDYKFPKSSGDLNDTLYKMTTHELLKICEIRGIKTTNDDAGNHRRLVRMIVADGNRGTRNDKIIENTIVVGISTEKDNLRQRVEARVHQMITQGVVKEARALSVKYGWNSEAMTGNIYPLCREYLNDMITIDELIKLMVLQDMKLVKKQLTWFRRNKFIHWSNLKDAGAWVDSEIKQFL